MAEECTHDCSTCGADCSSRQTTIPKEKLNDLSKVKHVIGVVSGKGGVGKSMVTSSLAVEMARKGYHVGILDADITGPSIAQSFGVSERALGSKDGIFPAKTKNNIQVISINMLIEDPTQPVVWRGPVIAGAVKQFWSEVIWEDVDYLFVDMPPGTGDVPLTVFQSIPVDGVVMVSSPQGLVKLIVKKAINMCSQMNIPILGLVENMSYVECDKCGNKMYIFGESKAEEIAKEHNIEIVTSLPINQEIAKLVDEGKMDEANPSGLEEIVAKLENL